MADIRPNQLPAAASVNPAAAIIVDAGGPVEKATPLQVVDAARPKASQGDAETGTDNDRIMTPLRVKQAIDELGVSAAALSANDGASLVGIPDGRDLQEYISDQGVYNAGIQGVSASSSASANAASLQAAINHVVDTGGLVLELPPGQIDIDGDVIVPAFGTDSPLYSKTLVIKGAGCGTNGTWLRFTSGSLRVRTSNHWLENFRVTSLDSDGIRIEPQTSPSNRYPVRSGMANVRSEYCELSGITIEDCWIYTMLNCYARFNKVAGIEGKTGALTNLACNNLNIIGGEFQGNGTIVGGNTTTGGTSKGTGAGIITGRCVQFSILNAAIEGNYADGLFVSEQCRGLSLYNVYFEKNGSHPDNRDILNAQPGSPVNGPNSFFLVNCNFTPQRMNGTAQTHAIDIYDCIDLRIVNPQFFALSEGPTIYSAEPIRVRESLAGRATGWVEGGWYSSSSYTQNFLLNECERYGFPRKHVFNQALTMPDAATTTTPRMTVPVPSNGGSRVSVTYLARRSGGSTGDARMQTTFRYGPLGTTWASPSTTVAHTSSPAATVRTTNASAIGNIRGTQVEVDVARLGTDGADTMAADLILQCVEITTYEGRIS